MRISPFDWEESVDPDGNNITYYYQVSHSPDMSDPIGEPLGEGNLNLASHQSTYDYLTSINLNESTFYWDIIATDGVFEQSFKQRTFFMVWLHRRKSYKQ